MDEITKSFFLKSVQTAYTELNMRRIEAMMRDNPKPSDGESDEDFFQRLEETYFGRTGENR